MILGHKLLIIFVALLFLFYLYTKTLSKGGAGEFAVKFVFIFLRNSTYKKFHNITIKDNDKTVQIDHLIISKYGIFVIETKNLSGTIYGNENASHFYKYNHKKKYEFYNPIKQNYGHIFALRNTLGDYNYISVVLFSGNANLKVKSKSFVGHIGSLPTYVKLFKKVVLSDSEVVEIVKKLKEISLKGVFVKSNHIKSVKQRIADYEKKIDKRICPKCGGRLVVRNGKYGKFTGCSSYPKCNFKKK